MIRLKLFKSQLYCLCNFTSPAKYESFAKHRINSQFFDDLDHVFNIVQIGEKATKQYLYTNKKKYSVRLSYSEAASLLKHMVSLEAHFTGGYDAHVISVIKIDLNYQLINYQSRFATGSQYSRN